MFFLLKILFLQLNVSYKFHQFLLNMQNCLRYEEGLFLLCNFSTVNTITLFNTCIDHFPGAGHCVSCAMG